MVAKQRATNVLTCSLKSSETLNETLEQFWKLENYDQQKARTPSREEIKCELHFEQTITRANDGRFIVRLPFREQNVPIGNNKEIALKRLNSLERTLKGNKVIHERYIKFMQEYADLGHMSIASSSNCGNVVYLPHHGVLKESSTSIKLHVVFDASARNKRGVSLNEALLVSVQFYKTI